MEQGTIVSPGTQSLLVSSSIHTSSRHYDSFAASLYVEDDSAAGNEGKKDSAGLAHPLILQVWVLLKQRAPTVCQVYLGDRPPRLTTAAQVALVYGVCLQLLTFYLWWQGSGCAVVKPVI